jgi:hypothetical protein
MKVCLTKFVPTSIERAVLFLLAFSVQPLRLQKVPYGGTQTISRFRASTPDR